MSRTACMILAAGLTLPATTPASAGGPGVIQILCAPADDDNPLFRAEISMLTGGAAVDYFDARVATPPPILLDTYDAVIVWSDDLHSYLEPALFGDNLGEYAEMADRCVIMGYGSLDPTIGLGGAITLPPLCPVVLSTLGDQGPTNYNQDGTTCIFDYTSVYFAVAKHESISLATGFDTADGTLGSSSIIAAGFNDDLANGVPATPPVIYLNGANGKSGTDIPCWVAGALGCHGVEIDPPDECPEDLNRDGLVAIDDLLQVLGAWGTPDGDVNIDYQTDVDDVLAVLANWGDCKTP